MIEDNCQVILPIMFPALYRISKEHWNQVSEKSVESEAKMICAANFAHVCGQQQRPNRFRLLTTDDCRHGLQRPQVVYGDEFQAV